MRCNDGDDYAVYCKFCSAIMANINNRTTTLTTTESSMTNTTATSADGRIKSPLLLPTSEQHSQTASPSVTTTTTETTDEASTMNAEIEAAVTFLTDLIKAAQFSAQLAEQFRKALTFLLKDYYNGHWYPEEPLKGSGYRCLRVNGVMNPLLKKAAESCRMPLKKFRQAFPVELTVWVDPGDVSVRFGEEGSIGVYYAKAGNCLKHDHQNMEELQRLAASAPKRTSPQLVTSCIGGGSGSSRSSPATTFVFSPYDGKSLKISPQTPPRKIIQSYVGGRHTPTPSTTTTTYVSQNPYTQQQQMMYNGFGSPVIEHHQQQHQLHHQSPPSQHHFVEFAHVRRPSPSPSPPDAFGNAYTGDWCKSEYQMYGNNLHFGSTNSQLPYGRFARMMNACGRQEPVGAN